MLDYRIDNAKVFDGHNFSDCQRIGIKDGAIALLGSVDVDANIIIDGKGKLLTPAFVDTHSHADFLVSHIDNDGGSSISQGIGTLVVGNCGMSSTPVTEPFPLLSARPNEKNMSCTDHLHYVKDGLSLNIGELLGHNTLRLSVLGKPRQAKGAETASMCSMLHEFMEAGWLGMSVGLNYPEAKGYTREELLALSRVLAKFDRPLTCHIRDQAEDILDAMDEVINITSEAGCKVLLSHLRPLRTANHRDIVPEMERRFDENSHAYFDMYPYVAGCTTLNLYFETLFHAEPTESELLSPDMVTQAVQCSNANGFADVHIIRHSNPDYEKKTVKEIAKNIGDHPGLAIQSVYLEDPDCVCIFNNNSSQKAVDRLFQHDRCLIGSDAWLYPTVSDEPSHPRNFGAFTRFLTRYVRAGRIDLTQGLRRITSGAADFFGLDAGRIALGKRADLALFSLEELQERADFKNPCQISRGMEGVWIAGHLAFNGTEICDASRPGVRLSAS